MDKHSYLSNSSAAYIEEQYKAYLEDPKSVEFGWAKFFEGFDFAKANYDTDSEVPDNVMKEFKVIELINGYRSRGHLFTQTNPVRERRKYAPTMDPSNYGLTEADMSTVFQAGNQCGIGPSTLKDIIEHLQTCYCQSIGVEFMFMRNPEKLDWFKQRLHKDNNLPSFAKEEKLHIFDQLNKASVFESFLHNRFTGQKRFSIEGAESLIPALDRMITAGSGFGVEEVVFGMAHRGRLNVLANILNKDYKDIMSEFEGKDYADESFDGDVKYHLGYTSEYKVGKKKVAITLCPNPSHLETVGPVVEGVSRAKVDKTYEGDDAKVMPVLIHGDAAIAGQGVVYEVAQMSQLPAYKTGGTIHIVINNQVGFTTNYIDGRSSTYCTDIAKVVKNPIFHVNGDDPEALVHVMQIAVEYRQKYKSDVYIDLLAYRKYGHNEGDEPMFTQPLLYKAIKKHPNPRTIYLDQLIAEGNLNADEGKKYEVIFKEILEQKFEKAKKIKSADIPPFLENIKKGERRATDADFESSPKTGVSKKKLVALGKKLTNTPSDKKLFRKMERILGDRAKMMDKNSLDWGMAELLAYASLVDEGHGVRMSGQDVERGTFSHRHAVVTLEDSGEHFSHLNHVKKGQAPFSIHNSLLSEYAVLGFEYGYSMLTPNDLTIWEAQFGDFVNGAQIMIDQYISSGEDKWNIMNSLVMLLPHGYEGMGPEHSSGRMERFLTLSAELNMQVVNCTTPANFFHVLRRQVKRDFRKPLIVFTPKSLLRHPKCVSTLEDLNGKFQEVIDDHTAKANDVKSVVFCQGKVYYELLAEKEALKAKDVALVRIEQMYPLPDKQMDAVVKKYKNAEKHLWVQEEPENMGAWTHMLRSYRNVNWQCVSRPASASPASGSPERSAKRQRAIIDEVFKKSKKKATAK